MDKKGENLATKEDIEEITRKTEEVQREFKEEFEAFSSDMKFKYDFFYKQYLELYCKLYAIIIQSEYVRHFIKWDDSINLRCRKWTHGFTAVRVQTQINNSFIIEGDQKWEKLFIPARCPARNMQDY